MPHMYNITVDSGDLKTNENCEDYIVYKISAQLILDVAIVNAYTIVFEIPHADKCAEEGRR